MITLENEIMSSILADIVKGKTKVTASDVQFFFDKSHDKIKALLKEKQLALKHAKEKHENFKLVDQQLNPQSVVEHILDDLKNHLELATLEFANRKQAKRNNLIKRLKLSAEAGKPEAILQCLRDIQSVNNTIKDARIADLQKQIYKYSIMADKEGVVYLKFYTKQEEKENLSFEITSLSAEIDALSAILKS